MTNTRAVLRRSRDYMAIIGVCFVLAAAFHREQVTETPKPQDKTMEQVEP